jgi:hypothetical protein
MGIQYENCKNNYSKLNIGLKFIVVNVKFTIIILTIFILNPHIVILI